MMNSSSLNHGGAPGHLGEAPTASKAFANASTGVSSQVAPIGACLGDQSCTRHESQSSTGDRRAASGARWWDRLPHGQEFAVKDAHGVERRVLKTPGFSVELLRLLRESQFGRISLAAVMARASDGVLHRTDSMVAVKEYDKQLVAAGYGQLSRSQIREDVHMELRLWSRLSQSPRHPNILPLLGLAQDSSRLLAVTEHAPLGDCFDYCHAHSFRLGRILARSLCAQGAHALAFAHARRVAHRDVSLENFVLARTASGGPLLQLIDFGLATDVPVPPGREAGRARFVRVERSGKVTYMAPEVYCAPPDHVAVHDPYASDVWSLACAFFILVTGSQPFEQPLTTFAPPGQELQVLAAAAHADMVVKPRTTFDLIAMGRVEDAMRVCRAPEDLVAQVGPLLQSMMRMDPAARPTAAELLCHPWVADAVLPAELEQAVREQAAELAELATGRDPQQGNGTAGCEGRQGVQLSVQVPARASSPAALAPKLSQHCSPLPARESSTSTASASCPCTPSAARASRQVDEAGSALDEEIREGYVPSNAGTAHAGGGVHGGARELSTPVDSNAIASSADDDNKSSGSDGSDAEGGRWDRSSVQRTPALRLVAA